MASIKQDPIRGIAEVAALSDVEFYRAEHERVADENDALRNKVCERDLAIEMLRRDLAGLVDAIDSDQLSGLLSGRVMERLGTARYTLRHVARGVQS